MFGYVQPDKPELKIREYEIYRAYYCGVCKAIQKNHGNLPRLTLNYDTTFLALLLCSVSDVNSSVQLKRCALHPLKKRKMIQDSEIIDYAADMNVLLSYLSLKDKWQDGRSAAALAGLAALKRRFQALTKKYPEKSRIILERLNELAQLEQSRCASVDQAAEPFARLMEEVMLYRPACRDKGMETILRWIGYNIGKWIYTIDALDDLEEDIRKHAYNPFLFQYGYKGENTEEFREQILKDAEFSLVYTLNEAAKGFELLNFKRNKDIIGNILYSGMLKKTENILGRGSNLERPV
jgi:hypothetical protein